MVEIPQPVNVQARQSPPTPSTAPKNHGLRINVPEQDHAPADEVSPLTPRAAEENGPDEQPVSPIEPLGRAKSRAPLPERPPPSQIPRKVFKQQPVNEKSETKWDAYSGEPTDDERGKASTVRPGSQPLEMQYPHLKERTKQILAGLRERDSAKKTPWGKMPPPVAADPLDDPPQRAPWKGASGRATIVEPVKNTPTARKPLPRQQVPQPVSVPLDATTLTPSEQPEDIPSSPTLRRAASEEEIKPVVPLKTRNLTPELSKKSPTHSPEPQSPAISPEPPFTPTILPPDSLHPRVESPQYDPEPTTPTTPPAEPGAQMDKFGSSPPSFVQPEIEREQSRFSWTTYTTSVAESPPSEAQGLRGSSPPPPMPDLPPIVTIKKRPVSTSPFMHSQPYTYRLSTDSNASVVRKPLPLVTDRSLFSRSVSRPISTSKSLPPTPTVIEATNKIASLEAQLEALNRRKHNTSQIIANLEGALKRNAIIYERWKRLEVEKNIINHKNTLDDIGREIHELSIQLSRAQRKRDLDAGVETSPLWIKRVTS